MSKILVYGAGPLGIMRKNHALQILPVLAANRHTLNVLFLMNNAAGPEALVEALGREHVASASSPICTPSRAVCQFGALNLPK